jgi:hypothetical protein
VQDNALSEGTPVEEKSILARLLRMLVVPRVTVVNPPPIKTEPFGSKARQKIIPSVDTEKVPSIDPSALSRLMRCGVKLPPIRAFPSGSWAIQ